MLPTAPNTANALPFHCNGLLLTLCCEGVDKEEVARARQCETTAILLCAEEKHRLCSRGALEEIAKSDLHSTAFPGKQKRADAEVQQGAAKSLEHFRPLRHDYDFLSRAILFMDGA